MEKGTDCKTHIWRCETSLKPGQPAIENMRVS